MSDIPGYEDWPTHMRDRPLLDGDEWTRLAADLMGVPRVDKPRERIVETWKTGDGRVSVTEYAWSVGFGPENHGYLLHAAGLVPHDLPCLMILHSHGGVKSIGAWRDLPKSTGHGGSQAETARAYADPTMPLFSRRAVAEGYAVFIPDAFSWGSRRFDLDTATKKPRDRVDPVSSAHRYDARARKHEHVIAKAANALGTSYPGMIAADDLISLSVARSVAGNPAVIGHSGGGGRAINLSALCPDIDRVGVISMMTTMAGLFPDHISDHSWLLHIPGLTRACDLPELAANRRSQHLCVIYGEQDHLFSGYGMHDAHDRLVDLFAGQPGTYEGWFHPGGHEFGEPAQEHLLRWLARTA